MRLRSPAVLALACVPAIALGSGAGVARADGPVTFGPDLSQLDVNNTNDCTVDPLIQWPGNSYTGAPSCTWTSTDPTTPNGGQLPPTGNGTISQVMVKVGAVTGPMQVVIMQAEFQEVDLPYIHYQVSCCTDVGQSAPFTPAANAITTEPVNLPVQVGNSDGYPGQYVADFVGLSVLEDGVPVPAADETTLSPLNNQPALELEQPAMQDNGQPQLADGGIGFLVAMDGVWVPDSTPAPNPGPGPNPNPGPNPAPGPTAPPAANPTLPSTTPLFSFPAGAKLARVAGNSALVQIACGAGGPACDGTVRIQSARPHGRGAHLARVAKVVTYAAGSFALTAGNRQAIKAKLSRAGRMLAARHKTLRVWINVTLSSGTVMSKQVTLRF
jgi:hypothetical protein